MLKCIYAEHSELNNKRLVQLHSICIINLKIITYWSIQYKSIHSFGLLKILDNTQWKSIRDPNRPHNRETQNWENVTGIWNVLKAPWKDLVEKLWTLKTLTPINLFTYSTNICDRKYGKMFRQRWSRDYYCIEGTKSSGTQLLFPYLHKNS